MALAAVEVSAKVVWPALLMKVPEPELDVPTNTVPPPLALLLVKTVRSPAVALFVNIIDPPGRSR